MRGGGREHGGGGRGQGGDGPRKGGRRSASDGPVFLTGDDLTFERTPGGVLRLHLADRCYTRVDIRYVFPFSRPDSYLSIGSGDEEVGLLRDLDSLHPEQRALVEDALARYYFQPVIQKIKSVKYIGSNLAWDVKTDHGQVEFVSRHPRHCVVPLDDGRYLLTDSERNRYVIPRLGEVDAKSRHMLLDLLS